MPRNRSKKKSTTPGGAAQRRTQRESEDISDMGSPEAYDDEDDGERGYDEALDFPSSVMIRKGPWEGKEYTVVVYTETNFSWEVQQRYSKFDSLKNGLVSQRGWKTAVEALEFPKKTMSSAPTEERRAQSRPEGRVGAWVGGEGSESRSRAARCPANGPTL